MVAKRSSRALALLLALPSAAFALGLGDIRLLSPLNAPLDAEVDLVDVAPDEVNTVQAQLASRETFARYGLEWPAYLSNVQVHVRNKDGHQILKLTSTAAISEPFVTVLVEVGWSRGHLVREYTLLLDPPVYTPAPASAASAPAPVTAPATGTGVHEGAIARSAETPAATPAGEPSAASAPTGESAAPAGRSPPASAPAPGGEASAPSAHVVQHGETLSGIASGIAGNSANAPRTRSWMLAIYEANPRAFERNMNVMHSGAVLRIPDATQAAAVSPTEASAEIHRQYTAWRSASGAGAATAGEQPGRLKLVTPTESPAAGASAAAASAEVGKLQGRVHDLEGQLAESKRLLDLRNAELARMQAQLAAKNAPAPRAAPPPPPPPVARETAPAPAPATAPTAPPAAEQPMAQAAPPPETAPPPPVAQPPAAPTPSRSTRPPASGGSILDSLSRYWWIVGVLLLALLAAVASRILRSRRAQQFDDSLGRLAVAGASAADTGVFAQRREHTISEQPAASAAAAEPTFLVEESGSHERPRLSPAAAAAAAPRHVTSDETISSDTAINLDQGDPLAEADFHMAYGLYDQAADLIRIAISREPDRRDLKLKLLEVFFVWGNKEQFLQTARELADSREHAAPGEWEKILIMGKQLAPEDPLFSGGAVRGATAGGVDLDLEGGQSRVDFDLLGEPSAAEASAGLDLDIGSAVGDQTLDSPANITDRNAALEGTMASRTGTTRQMTAHLRHDDAALATGEIEGPTVEQPAMAATAEHPTIRQKVETALRQSSPEQTAELALDDLGLDVGHGDTLDQPGLAAGGAEGPTLVAGLDDTSRQAMEKAAHQTMVSTGQWQFDQSELEAALTQTSLRVAEVTPTERIAAFGAQDVDVDVGTATDTTGTHPAAHTGVDVDVGAATGTHAMGNGGALDLDVGTATVPDAAFAATQRLSADDLALPDIEPVTMSEVGTKLDLARAYMDMGDPDGARNILEEVLAEGSAAQKQEAQRLIESLPG